MNKIYSFGAIVLGSGITRGRAAKELTGKWRKVLMLKHDNPSLTFMALTACAADYAVNQLKAGKV